jgi:hypothetical protein
MLITDKIKCAKMYKFCQIVNNETIGLFYDKNTGKNLLF